MVALDMFWGKEGWFAGLAVVDSFVLEVLLHNFLWGANNVGFCFCKDGDSVGNEECFQFQFHAIFKVE